jgi:Ca2+-binding EF-hand superfamily protein
MARTNGKPVTVPEQTDWNTYQYRPDADTEKVHEAIAQSLAEIVSISTIQADKFISLFELYDKDATLAVRYGHLVDATECLEIALTHLGQLKAAVSHRLRIEDDQNGLPF